MYDNACTRGIRNHKGAAYLETSVSCVPACKESDLVVAAGHREEHARPLEVENGVGIVRCMRRAGDWATIVLPVKAGGMLKVRVWK